MEFFVSCINNDKINKWRWREKKGNELSDLNDYKKRFNLNESEFKDNTVKKHVYNVIYHSFVHLCIHALVCILTPVY